MEQIIETRECRRCTVEFHITDRDQAFYDKIGVPRPTLCHNCRQQRRLAQGNQLYLYKKKCDLTGKEIISNFHPDSPFKVYDMEAWFSDAWDPCDYGRDFDFNRPFFEQFKELWLEVPRPALQRGYQYDENSDYTNYAGKNKNCYLIFDSDQNEDCYYSYSAHEGISSMDCYRFRKGELLYGCVDTDNCYNCYFLQDCSNCSDSYFLKNCIGCKNCIMCCNLRNKEYHINNKPVSKEEFETYKKGVRSRTYIEQLRGHFEKFKLQFPQKYIHGVQNENVTGDYLNNCKDSYMCFDSPELWDCKYVYQAFDALKDSMDIQECGDGEKIYESCFGGYNAYDVKFCSHFLGGDPNDLQYCMYSQHGSHLFGCVSTRHKKYCILNKQYSKEEYEELVPKIIEHMKSTGEYGEFFPMSFAHFAYNKTMAQWHYPLTKEQVLAEGLEWREDDPKEYAPTTYQVPDTIDEISDDILKEVLACGSCSRNYKVMAQELKLLRQMGMPLPTECFFCRHDRRHNMRNAKHLFARECEKCGSGIFTTYSEDRPEIVYCEKCYLESVG
ncbi:hypothetical protein HOG48_04225 [Candidatus Peregrinibacteria bacterium]|jgi:hypothetical protein|nr:hypothetical protein [Candidatus Peregrinibacteria bacterium]